MNDKKYINSKSSGIKTMIIFLIAICVCFVIARYITDEEFRYTIDTKVLKKEVSEENLNTIEIDSDTNPSIFAYDKYIVVLSKNKLTEYTSDGKVAAQLDVNISVPIVEKSGKYMIIAEKDGQKIYLISGTSILWEGTVEGSITRVNVNRNGYVSVILRNTIYKSIVAYYDLSGKELFRKYVSTNYAVCSAISTNNKYLAIGEIDYSGTIIKSYINIISVELAQTDSANSVVYTYESENGEIITSIDYKGKNRAICMFNNYIQMVTPDNNERLYDFTSNDVFIDINLKDGFAILDKQSSGLFSYEYEIKVKSINNKSENLYILNSDLPKSVSVSGNIIGLNLGNEVQIVNSNGWLVKKYTSSKQINSIVIGDNIAGVVYKNRIEIIDL